jgi:mersacidin/lichenicidin family type 2 lantibiotic
MQLVIELHRWPRRVGTRRTGLEPTDAETPFIGGRISPREIQRTRSLETTRRIIMNNDQIIRSWKDKKFSASLRASGRTAPTNPAGSGTVSMKDLEGGEFMTSPMSVCSIGPRCQCGA